jgi:hypothetical protein
MHTARFSFGTIVGIVGAVVFASTCTPHSGERFAGTRSRAGDGTATAFSGLPLTFEEHGTAEEGRFLARGNGYAIFLSPTESVLVLRRARDENAAPELSGLRVPSPNAPPRRGGAPTVVRVGLAGANPNPGVQPLDRRPGVIHYYRGNDPAGWRENVSHYAKVRYTEVYPGIDLAYYGNGASIEYDFVVGPGADPNVIRLAFEGVGDLALDRAGDLIVQMDDGNLVHRAPVVYQEVASERREVHGRYVIEGDRRTGFQVAFALGAYDRTRPLIIDPVLHYATYLGGSDADEGLAIAVDGAGNVYVTGTTWSADFPQKDPAIPGPPPGACFSAPCNDAFVARLNPAGTALVYATYLGGNHSSRGLGIVVDDASNAYVVGGTSGSTFPTTAGVVQPASAGGWDATVTKLDPAGQLAYSTYLGSPSGEFFTQGITVDAAGHVYVTGGTVSPHFPTTPGALATTCSFTPGTCSAGQCQNIFSACSVDSDCDVCTGLRGFVSKLTPAGDALVYSTQFGGTGGDSVVAIAVDETGAAYLTGSTQSLDFPVSGAFQATHGGGPLMLDGYVAKLAPGGDALEYASYLGGSGDDIGNSVAIDSLGRVYVSGDTQSTDFPTTANAVQPTFGGGPPAGVCGGGVCDGGTSQCTAGFVNLGCSTDEDCDVCQGGVDDGKLCSGFATDCAQGGDAFVVRVDDTGGVLDYATYLGGSGHEIASGMALRGDTPYLVGKTSSATDFPTTANAFQGTFGGGQTDIFVTRLSSDGGALLHSTFIGGSDDTAAFGQEVGLAVAVDAEGNAYLTGHTSATDFPVTVNALQDNLVGSGFTGRNGFLGLDGFKSDAVVVKLPMGSNPPAAPNDHFLCYKSRESPGSSRFTEIAGLGLADGFLPDSVDVKKRRGICNPADKNREGTLDRSTHLLSYTIRGAKGAPKHVRQTFVVADQFGELSLDTVKPDRLLVPSAKDESNPIGPPDATQHDVDHYKCYKVRITRGTPKLPKGLQVALEDQFAEPKVFALKKPKRLCIPAEKTFMAATEPVKNPHGLLTCYKVKRASGEARHLRRAGIYVNNQLEVVNPEGPAQLDTVKVEELCVPATTAPVCGDDLQNQLSEECDGADAPACPGLCDLDCVCTEPPLLSFTTTVPGGSCGRVNDDASGAGIDLLGLDCGSLYLGDGTSTQPPSGTPEGSTTFMIVTDQSDPQNFLLGPSSGTGPADCSFAGCLFGPPLPVLGGLLPVCIVNTIAQDVTGTFDSQTGDLSLNIALNAGIYVTNPPCPLCVAGLCDGGPNQNQPCTTNNSLGTSADCPPGAGFFGAVPTDISPLVTGTTSVSAADGLFCPGQGTAGAFGLAGAQYIEQNGSAPPPAGGAAVLGSVFCVAATGNALIDGTAGLPGPGATALPGTVTVP